MPFVGCERSTNENPRSFINDISWNSCRHLPTDVETTDVNYFAVSSTGDTLKSQTHDVLQDEDNEIIYGSRYDSRGVHSPRLNVSMDGKPRVNGKKNDFCQNDANRECCSDKSSLINKEKGAQNIAGCQRMNGPSPVEDGENHARYNKDDLITDETVAVLESADTLDFCTGIDQDWQRIWLHIKPFGRRTPHCLISRARSTERGDVDVASGGSSIPDKVQVKKPTDTMSDNRRSSGSERSGSGRDVVVNRRCGSKRSHPTVLRARKERNTNQNNHCNDWKPACGDGTSALLVNDNRKPHWPLPGDMCRPGVTIHAIRDAQLGRKYPPKTKDETPSTTSASTAHCRRDEKCPEYEAKTPANGDRRLPSWVLNDNNLSLRVGRVLVEGTWRSEQWQGDRRQSVDAAAGDGRALVGPARLPWSSVSSVQSVVAGLLASISAKDILRPWKTRRGVIFSNQIADNRNHSNQMHNANRNHSNELNNNRDNEDQPDNNRNNSNNDRYYYTSDDTVSDTEHLVTRYASYDSTERRATIHQRGITSARQRINNNEQLSGRRRTDNANTHQDNRSSGDHRYYSTKYSDDDDDYSSGGEAAQTKPLLHSDVNGENVEDGGSTSDEDTRPDRVIINECRSADRFVRAIL